MNTGRCRGVIPEIISWSGADVGKRKILLRTTGVEACQRRHVYQSMPGIQEQKDTVRYGRVWTERCYGRLILVFSNTNNYRVWAEKTHRVFSTTITYRYECVIANKERVSLYVA